MGRVASIIILIAAARTAAVAQTNANGASAPDELPLTPIRSVLEDRDGDTIPDQIDQTVRVRGVVVVDSTTFSDDYFQVVIDDSTGGVQLFNRRKSFDLAIGTRVEATGVVSQYRGGVQISHVDVRSLGEQEPPEPVDLAVKEAASWRWFGRTVRVEGTLGELDLGSIARIPLTGSDVGSLDLFFPRRVGRAFPFAEFPAGSRVVAVGVVSIYKPSLPYDSGFQLIIRDIESLSVVAPPPPEWRRRVGAWSAASLIVVLSAVVIVWLMRRRRLDRERELGVINQISAVLASSSTRLDELLDLAAATFVDHHLAEASSIHLFDVERRLVFRASAGLGPGSVEQLDREDVRQDLAAAVIRRDAGGEGVSPDDHWRADLEASVGLRVAALLPLSGRRSLVGALILFASPGAGGAAMSRLVDSSANLIALGIENILMERQSEEDREELKQLAITDDLTGLYNRRFLDEYLRIQTAMARRRATSIAFLSIDIDHFKHVNDAWGHEAGDRVLVRAAEVFRGIARSSDLPVRYGGEEFLIVMPDATDDGVLAFAERLRKSFEEMAIDGPDGAEPIRLTISIGIAFYPRHGEHVRGVLRASDEALYRSKREGRNRVTVAE